MQPQSELRKDIGMKPSVNQTVGKKIEQKANVPVPKKLNGEALWNELVQQVSPLVKKSDFDQTLGTIELAMGNRTKAQREAMSEYLHSKMSKSGLSKDALAKIFSE